MSTRATVAMEPREVDAFLAGQLKVQVGTNGRHGVPHLTTMFYVLRDGEIAFWTYARSQKARNLERDPRIGCLVEDGVEYADLRGASIRGRAELVRDPEQVFAIGSAVVARMSGVADFADLGETGRAEVERQVGKRVGVIVHADEVATWDHTKMRGRQR